MPMTGDEFRDEARHLSELAGRLLDEQQTLNQARTSTTDPAQRARLERTEGAAWTRWSVVNDAAKAMILAAEEADRAALAR